jgi:Uma2 family endonuclease
MNHQIHRIRPFAAGLNVKDFLAFYASRPDKERWELIEGVAVMMPQPTLAHNRIALNLAMALILGFRRTRAPLFAYTDSGVRTPGVSNYMPRPDVMVAASSSSYENASQSYRLAAEVLSPSNSKRDVRLKLRHY